MKILVLRMVNLIWITKAGVPTVILFFLLFLTSCEPKLESLSDKEVDDWNEAILSSRDSSLFFIESTGARGDLWNAWDEAFFSCFQNQTFKKRDRIYLGPSNPRYLGTILSKNLSSTKTELQYIIPPQDYIKFATLGVPVTTCDLKKVKNISLDILLEAAFAKMEDSLRITVSRYKNITLTGGEWQHDYLRTTEFINYLTRATDDDVKLYRESLASKKNVVLTDVIKINGFSAEIEVVDTLKGGLKVALEGGVKVPVNTATGTGSIDFGISKTSSKIVKVSSSNEFYIYGKAQKSKNLK